MTERERFIRCVLNKPIDRVPLISYFPPWGETNERWQQEGAATPSSWLDDFGFDQPVCLLAGYVNHYFYPPIEEKVLSREGNHEIYVDCLSITNERIVGVSGIPKILKNPVENRADWEKLKAERLNPDDPGRIHPEWKKIAKNLNGSDMVLQLGAYPYGFFGTLRDLIGAEELLVMFYDEPDLVRDIMNDLADFWLRIYEIICRDVDVQMIHIWEDMSGKTGSLISPDMMNEFMKPCYLRVKAFADAHHIPVIVVDTDGNISDMVDTFLGFGVNLMLPVEVQAGSDVVWLRERFKDMSFFGGIDKRMLAISKEAIDAELARIEPLLKGSGYLPAPDHLVPPDVSWENYSYYANRLRELVYKHKREV